MRSVRAADTVVLQAYKSICARARLQLVALGIGESAQGMTRRQHPERALTPYEQSLVKTKG